MSNEINKKSENNFITVTNSHVKIELDSNSQNDIIEEKVTKSDILLYNEINFYYS